MHTILPQLVLLVGLGLPAAAAAPTGVQDSAEQELQDLLQLERAEAVHALRRGDLRTGLRLMDEHLGEDASDAASRRVRALLRARASDWNAALADAERALADAHGRDPRLRAACARTQAELLIELGRPDEALAVLEGLGALIDAQSDARDAWLLGQALSLVGRDEEARAALRAGMEGEQPRTWERALARARCERRLGFLSRAARSVVDSEPLPGEWGEGGRGQPELLSELASLYFEADGEVDHPEAKDRSPADLFRAALEASPGLESALLGMHELYQVNWMRRQRSAADFLDDLFAAAPDSLAGLARAARVDLGDGALPAARARLARLRELAPGRRDGRALLASLWWVEHRRDEARALLAELQAQAPGDAQPLVTLGRTLCDLYRFGEAVEFLRAAVEVDPGDREAWTQLGRALANTGATAEGLLALERASEVAEGRKDVWRHNTRLVLQRMRDHYVTEQGPGDLSFTWDPDGAEVLAAYQIPFYAEARDELAGRYGFTPGPVNVQVFDRFGDFSVRSTGFEGFPALGVCFGPVVTSVSPVSELRGRFSWARTCFHEFTHVIHLGLSHNRCPRWITEGLATWEEEQRNPAWTRNMRRDLLDAAANDDLIPVRELNRAFRGPRILFGYYQGGLLCKLLIDEYGFPPMIRLLQAFDRGLDVDQAFEEVYGTSPEEIDVRFAAFVELELAGIALEPRWGPTAIAQVRLGLSEQPPSDERALADWRESWATVGWGRWQAGRRVDSEQALRHLSLAGDLPPRAHFLVAEMALSRGERKAAREAYEAGEAAGGRDFRTSMALGRLALDRKDLEAAERHLVAAQEQFPGYPEKNMAAELLLADVYGQQEREEDMYRARERWLAWNSDEYAMRVSLARWHVNGERPLEAERWFREANEIDPMRRALHLEWGLVLRSLERWEQGLREFQVALQVPPALDLDQAGPASQGEHARLLGLQAEMLLALGRDEEARDRAQAALDMDADCAEARAVLERSP